MWWLGICFSSKTGLKQLCHTCYLRFQVSSRNLDTLIETIKVNMIYIHFIRTYWASNSPQNLNTWSQAMQFCEDMGRGLVKWDTAPSYLDLKHLSSQGAYWTALTNTNGADCDGASACNGLLVCTYKVTHQVVDKVSLLLHLLSI